MQWYFPFNMSKSQMMILQDNIISITKNTSKTTKQFWNKLRKWVNACTACNDISYCELVSPLIVASIWMEIK